MKRVELARKLARLTHQTPAQAKDEIDALAHRILTALRKGRPVTLPLMGKLTVLSGAHKGRR